MGDVDNRLRDIGGALPALLKGLAGSESPGKGKAIRSNSVRPGQETEDDAHV